MWIFSSLGINFSTARVKNSFVFQSAEGSSLEVWQVVVIGVCGALLVIMVAVGLACKLHQSKSKYRYHSGIN